MTSNTSQAAAPTTYRESSFDVTDASVLFCVYVARRLTNIRNALVIGLHRDLTDRAKDRVVILSPDYEHDDNDRSLPPRAWHIHIVNYNAAGEPVAADRSNMQMRFFSNKVGYLLCRPLPIINPPIEWVSVFRRLEIVDTRVDLAQKISLELHDRKAVIYKVVMRLTTPLDIEWDLGRERAEERRVILEPRSRAVVRQIRADWNIEMDLIVDSDDSDPDDELE